MGAGGPLFDAAAGAFQATRAQLARGVQRPAPRDQDWRALALDAERPAALGGGHQQAQRWLAAGCFKALAEDLRAVLRLAAGQEALPSAAILNSRTLRSSPESGERAGYDGAKHEKGSKLHPAFDMLGQLLALHVTPASADDRAEVRRLAQATVQASTGQSVELA